MEKADISLLFNKDDVYLVSEETEKRKINADLMLIISVKGSKEKYEEIVRRLIQSLKMPDKTICAEYDMPLHLSLRHNCRRIIAMGFSPGQSGIHADFAANKIIYFMEKYILPTEDLIVIDKDAVKKKQFWKLLQELLSCGD